MRGGGTCTLGGGSRWHWQTGLKIGLDSSRFGVCEETFENLGDMQKVSLSRILRVKVIWDGGMCMDSRLNWGKKTETWKFEMLCLQMLFGDGNVMSFGCKIDEAWVEGIF